MIKTHIIKLYPTKLQEILFKKSCGVARFSYNWGLSKWKELYETGEKPTAYTLIKLQNKIKKDEFPWMLEVSKNAPQYAIHNLESAFKSFFKRNTKYPKFHKKGIKDSFVAIENSLSFKQKDFKIHIPRIGKIKCAENLRYNGKVNYVVIKRTANMWFAIININIVPNDTPITIENQDMVGVDLGIKSMIVLSDGIIFNNPKVLFNNLKKLKRQQRSLSRKNIGSNNRKKQQVKLSRLHYKISCIRKNNIHEATSYIVNNYNKIVIEDLHIINMLKNKSLSQKLNDISFGEIRRQLEYKCKWKEKELIIADQYFPSSKICSKCGNKKDKLLLSERIYKCNNCGLEIDRDLNAAINLVNYNPTQKYCESKVSGELSSTVSQFSNSMNEKLSLTIKT